MLIMELTFGSEKNGGSQSLIMLFSHIGASVRCLTDRNYFMPQGGTVLFTGMKSPSDFLGATEGRSDYSKEMFLLNFR